MSTVKNPAAFPLAVPGDCVQQPEWGMSLRDWFAGQAAGVVLQRAFGADIKAAEIPQFVAELSYSLADAMLSARTEGNT